MGLFNHLFKNKKDRAEEIIIDENKRLALWEAYLKNFELRESLAESFSPKKISSSLSDPVKIKKTVERLASLIPPEIVDIDEVERLEKEIFYDLSKLKSEDAYQELGAMLVLDREKEKTILNLFKELHKILTVQLNLLKALKASLEKETLVGHLLISIYELIKKEYRLLKPFLEDRYQKENRHLHAEVIRVARAVLLCDELEKKKISEQEKVARTLLKQLVDKRVDSEYWLLAEDVFSELAKKAGAPLSTRDEDVMKGYKKIEKFMKDDALLSAIIKKIRPNYSDEKIKGVIVGLREGYLEIDDVLFDALTHPHD